MLSRIWSWIGRGQISPEEPESPEAAINEPDADNLGLFTLTPEDAGYNIDIVAIHGLGGDYLGTWTDYNGKLWLRDFIPVELPNARVLSYGYDSKTTFSKSVLDITIAATNLLDRLDGIREGVARTRPIIFISHSLGGIVAKKALVIAHERSGIYGDLLGSVRGSVFFGVPHGGADVAYWGSFAANLLNNAQLNCGTNSRYVEALKKNSKELEHISEQFVERGAKLRIRTFFETVKMGNQLIVDAASTRLGLANEIAVGVDNANHRNMCKFSSAGSQKYIPVRNAITKMVRLAIEDTTASQTWSNEETKCLSCLYTSDYESHKERNPSPTPGTCKWILIHPKYLVWKEAEQSSLLWISADPGCGKSVLSSFLIDEFKSKQTSATPTSTVCHFFFKDDSDAQSSASNALCAILYQLCSARNQLIQYPLKEYSKKKGKFVTEVTTLWKMIISATAEKDCGAVICVLDGLDECQADSRKLLLKELIGFYSAQSHKQLQRGSCQLKFLVTSRPSPAIERFFRKLPAVRLRAEEETISISEDIGRVVKARVEEIGEYRGLSAARQSELHYRLTHNADRTFLWVSLILQMIEDSGMVIQSIDNVMTQIPSSLDAIYAKILAQSTDVASAKTLLHIIIAALEPMSPQQLNIAVCIQERHSSCADLEHDLEPDFETSMKVLCGLFVRVIDDRVYLVHQTAREYLMKPADKFLAQPAMEATIPSEPWKHSLDTLQSNRILAQSCVWYVRIFALLGKGVLDDYLTKNRNGRTITGRGPRSYDTAHVLDALQKEEEDERWERRMGYKKNHWDSSEEEDEDEPRICKVNAAYEMAIRRGEVDEDGYYSSEPGSPVITSWDRMDRHVTNDSFMPYAGAWWHVHLRLSNVEPHEPLCQDAARLCEPNSMLFAIWTPIFRTTWGAPIALLPSKIDGGFRFRATSLTIAATFRQKSIVGSLLQRGIHNTAEERAAALFIAVKQRDLPTAELLIEEGKECVEICDANGRTPLHHVVSDMDEELLRLLLNHGVPMNLKRSENSVWLLFTAVKQGSKETVKTLLRHGVNVNATDRSGKTALFVLPDGPKHKPSAAKEVLEVLLERKANLEHKRTLGCTPLFYYIEKRRAKLAQLLLEKGASKQDIGGKMVWEKLAEFLRTHRSLKPAQLMLETFLLVHSAAGRPLCWYGVKDDRASIDIVSSSSGGILWTQLYDCAKANGYDVLGRERNFVHQSDTYGDSLEKAMWELTVQLSIFTVPHTHGWHRWKTSDELIHHQVEMKREDEATMLVVDACFWGRSCPCDYCILGDDGIGHLYAQHGYPKEDLVKFGHTSRFQVQTGAFPVSQPAFRGSSTSCSIGVRKSFAAARYSRAFQ